MLELAAVAQRDRTVLIDFYRDAAVALKAEQGMPRGYYAMTDISATLSRIQSIQNEYSRLSNVAQGGFQELLTEAMAAPVAPARQAPAPTGVQLSALPASPSVPAAGNKTSRFVELALAQRGKTYIYGAETDGQANPRAFDCSELVQWAMQQLGHNNFPDGSANQIAYATSIGVEEALRTPGALLYRPGHIAISLGDGKTIEARGRDYGVGVFGAHDRGWTAGGLIPELRR